MANAPIRPAHRLFAWGGALLFACSLGYFLFTYAVTFGETTYDGAMTGPILWNTGLFTVFALHHSLFAREPVRTAVARLVPAALERALYVWVASVLLIAVCILWEPVPGIAWQLAGPAVWGARGVQLAGILLTLRSAAIIDVWDLAGIRQLGAPPARVDAGAVMPRGSESAAAGRADEPHFRTAGPYGWVRHPIYSGWFLIVFAATPMTMTRLVFAVVSSAYILLAIPLEERTLRATSGGAYARYAAQVRRKLVPGLY